MRCLKMHVESTFSDKSSARSILTRASRLGILTFNKIRKKVFRLICYHFALFLFLFATKPFFTSLLFSLLARFL